MRIITAPPPIDRIGSFHCNYDTGYKTNIWYNTQSPAKHEITDISSKVVMTRNIKWLCHFTPRSNLHNIMLNGLVTRNLIPDNAKVTDSNRFDRNPTAICLSISRPNSPMMYWKEKDGFDLCLLLIDPAVLSNKECAFFPHNAATACYRRFSFEDLMGANSLEALFNPIVNIEKADGSTRSFTRSQFLPQYDTTSEQAEVQCRENIEPEYIRFVIEDNFPLDSTEIIALADRYDFAIIQQEQKARLTATLLEQQEAQRLHKQKEFERLVEAIFEPLREKEEEKKHLEAARPQTNHHRSSSHYGYSGGGSTGCSDIFGFIILIIILFIFVF